jgi:hypothetical protein
VRFLKRESTMYIWMQGPRSMVVLIIGILWPHHHHTGNHQVALFHE